MPHMYQLEWAPLAAEPGKARRVRVEGQELTVGRATDRANDCLIDTLRQSLGAEANLREVREGLVAAFPRGEGKVTERSFLELEHHWAAVLQRLGASPETFRIVCVDLTYHGNGDVVGQGAQTLYIARVGANHFVPLHRGAR